MLYRIVISPSTFCCPFQEENSQRLYFNTIIRILTDILENCILVNIPYQNTELLKIIKSSVERWPIKYKQRALELLKKIIKRHRVVSLTSSNFNVDHSNSSTYCELYSYLSFSASISALIGLNCCLFKSETLLNEDQKVDILGYDIANFTRGIRRTKLSQSFNRNEITTAKIEEIFFVPIFRDAKHIKLIDRYIGRSIIDRSSNQVDRFLSQGYRRTLEWIISIFVRESSRDPINSFEIYTGIEMHRIDQADYERIESAFNWFCQFIYSTCDIAIKIFVKQERNQRDNIGNWIELPHQRYLITDQVGFSIDRGFDLLNDDYVRDVNISLLCDPHKVETATRSLTNFCEIT